MADERLRTTLAYTKSPKTSRRTTFQDELEAAVSARASRHKTTESYAYSDDFDDDDDDILNELLKTRRKKMDVLKAGRPRAKVNDFKLSDDEEENVKPKKVSFMKTRRRSSPVQDELVDSGKSGRSDTVGSSDSQGSFPSYQGRNTPQSTRESLTPEKGHQDTPLTSQPESHAAWRNQSESPFLRKNFQSESFVSRKSLSESPLPLNSENSQWESPSLLPSEGSLFDSPLPLPSEKEEDSLRMPVGGDSEQPLPQPRERSARQTSLTGLVEDKPPRPRPRQRTVHIGGNGHDEEDGPVGTPSSRAATSSVSIPLSFTDGLTTTTGSSDRMGSFGSDGVQHTEEHQTMSFSSAQRGYEDLIGSLEGTGSVDLSVVEQSKEEKHSTSFEENQQEASEDVSRVTASRQSQSTIKSQDKPQSCRPASSRKSKSACSYTTESKYLGTLKVLDQKMGLQETQPEAADPLRAAVYQNWLKKKEEKLQATMKAKKQEEKLKEEKKAEEEMSKKAEAKASYEAWKEKKRETIKEKIREKQEAERKQQKEKEEKEERKETAKRVFEKWKQEHSDHLREQQRKQAQAESRLKEEKEKEQEERKKDCNSSFTQWSERKKDAIEKKMKAEWKKEKIKEIEEKYQKEEQEKTALEMYEKWLKRKEFQQKREKHEKKIKAIVQEEPPPPWSPPNRTIPFGK
ncbi:microtubule-associated protein 9 isoform X1 [Pygocentrus nattereri]|uniref:microtubule-associated protein 9 isoform X1 n=1 Tax=Pygocentrus nattereri TaxID=42514 RepID=UPI001891CDB5|nr:microtubule-associated protein 9 isoform X1 [Pygocentrus nattereri]XP_017564866.2 microtubule-associated protein 9 isoform X1 [Pygocentrus nattereri]